ncbi:lem3 cdc50 family protein [Diplodia corticola]|uniref:Lem3 cdc50 family protein n=1 Tax=Diplodia corticola TaxID=236234 RepID=A0A1J9R8G7_9PEZI|nr:lem3 cdc50 family protein [Diplodia corticola]OJD28691.1 lem3 cdc50 family protein [Diplodia corticola]
MSQTEMQHTDSISSNENDAADTKKTKSRRPANTAFRQQRLKAWQPILTPKTVLPLFFAVGIIFAPIGGLLIWASAMVEEISIDYTDCVNQSPVDSSNVTFPPSASTFDDVPTDRVSSYFKASNPSALAPSWAHSFRNTSYDPENPHNTTVCSLQFEIENEIGPPVLLYYRLTNFYQNHRRYVKSEDPSQLQGTFRSNSSISASDCDPLTLDSKGKAYYPCGLIANSVFNDTFSQLKRLNPASGESDYYNMSNKGIAWDSDKELFKKTAYTNDQVAPPPNWKVRYPNGYNDDTPVPDLSQDEGFMVWMRTAGLPTFSKLAMRNDDESMTVARYQIDIDDNFNVTAYGGTKAILISTRTVMGGKNPFLGIAYVVVGGICIVLGTLFTATHLIKPRKLGDHTYLTWNNEGASSATATGRSMRPGEA